jgi:hypothetical protein
VWSNQPYNFDHLGMGLISLFVTVTLNGYKGKMEFVLELLTGFWWCGCGGVGVVASLLSGFRCYKGV